MTDKVFERKYRSYLNKHPSMPVYVVNFFHNNRKKFLKQDIYKYKPFELKKEFSKLKSNNQEKKQNKIKYSEKIYDTDFCQIIRCESYIGAKDYMSNTNWCITNETSYLNYTYFKSSILYIMILKNKMFKHPKKFAFIVSLKDNKLYIYDEDDASYTIKNSGFSDDVFKIINSDVEKIKELDFTDKILSEQFVVDILSWHGNLFKKLSNEYKQKIMSRFITLPPNKKRRVITEAYKGFLPYFVGFGVDELIAQKINKNHWAKLDLKSDKVKKIIQKRIYNEFADGSPKLTKKDTKMLQEAGLKIKNKKTDRKRVDKILSSLVGLSKAEQAKILKAIIL